MYILRPQTKNSYFFLKYEIKNSKISLTKIANSFLFILDRVWILLFEAFDYLFLLNVDNVTSWVYFHINPLLQELFLYSCQILTSVSLLKVILPAPLPQSQGVKIPAQNPVGGGVCIIAIYKSHLGICFQLSLSLWKQVESSNRPILDSYLPSNVEANYKKKIKIALTTEMLRSVSAQSSSKAELRLSRWSYIKIFQKKIQEF